MAQLNFDASQVAPSIAPEAKPAGWYVCMMTASEMKPTKDGNGAFLECEFSILAPQEFAGQKFFDRLNLQNTNQTAVEIAYKTLSAICHATGVIQVQDSTVLHNRPLQLKVSLRPSGPGNDGVFREASNEVKGYKSVDGAKPQAAPAAYAPPPAAAAAAPQYAPPAAPQYAPPPPAYAQPPTQQAPIAPPAAPQWQPPAAPAPQQAPVAAPVAPIAPQYAPPPPAAAPAAASAAPTGAPVPPWMQKPAG